MIYLNKCWFNFTKRIIYLVSKIKFINWITLQVKLFISAACPNFTILSLYVAGHNKSILTRNEYDNKKKLNTGFKLLFLILNIILAMTLASASILISIGDTSNFIYNFMYIWLFIVGACGWGYWLRWNTAVWFYLWGFNLVPAIKTDLVKMEYLVHKAVAKYGENAKETVDLINEYLEMIKYDELMMELGLEESSWEIMYHILIKEPSHSEYALRVKKS